MSVSAKISQHNGNINWEERPQAERVWLRIRFSVEAGCVVLGGSSTRWRRNSLFFVVVVTHEVSKDLVFFSKFEDQSNNFFSCKIRVARGENMSFFLRKLFKLMSCKIFVYALHRRAWFIMSASHIPRTETQVKVFESDIPSHTNQNIGIF